VSLIVCGFFLVNSSLAYVFQAFQGDGALAMISEMRSFRKLCNGDVCILPPLGL